MSRQLEGTSRLVQATVDEGTHKALCELATIEDRPIAGVVRQAINLYLAQNRRFMTPAD